VQDTNDATGGRAEIRQLDFELSTLTAHLYNITLHGSEHPDQPPLLQVDKLTVGLKIQSLVHRKITLNELLVDHPVVHLGVDGEGKSNIPQSPTSKNSGHASVFDLAVGHVNLTDGEINYNDQKTSLVADLYDLGAEIRFDSLARRYSGRISYDNGHLRYAGYSSLPHSLIAKFNATPARLSLESAELKVGSSAISLRADMTDYTNPTVEGDYDIRIHTQDFGAMSRALTPAGDVSLSGGACRSMARSRAKHLQLRLPKAASSFAGSRDDMSSRMVRCRRRTSALSCLGAKSTPMSIFSI
jgi:hypothetical protein